MSQSSTQIKPLLKPSCRFTYGRGVLPAAQAFVIHCVPVSAEVYANTTRTKPVPDASHSYPSSVHFLIDFDGQITQFVGIQNTAHGLDKFKEARWPALPDMPYMEINEPFIHIGFVGDSLTLQSRRSLIEILSQYSHELQIPLDRLHVLSPNDLDVTRCCPTDIPEELLVEARTRSRRSGHVLIPDVVQLAKDVAANTLRFEGLLQRVCDQAEAGAALEQQVTAILEQIDGLDVAQLLADIAALQARDDALVEQLITLSQVVADQQACIDEVCGDREAECLQYSLLPSQSQQLVPDSPLWLNLPNQIEDGDPPKVLTGPLWSACLDAECTYAIEASATLELSEFCPGKFVRLELVACGVRYVIDEHVSAGGTETVALSGSTILVTPPSCKDTHLEITTDDDTTAFKVVQTANFKACCS